MEKAVIIGYGRFGQLLAKLLSNYLDVYIIDNNSLNHNLATSHNYQLTNIDNLSKFKYIFLAVPISSLESLLKVISPKLVENNVVIDVCSVKVYPVNLMKQYINKSEIIASHPMFGPDSASEGIKGLQIVLCNVRANTVSYEFIKNIWKHLEAEIIEITPEEHDKNVIYSQAFTYTLAKIFNEAKLPDINVITKSFLKLQDVANLSANDSEQLFIDMLKYNPYLSEMREKLNKSLSQVTSTINSLE